MLTGMRDMVRFQGRVRRLPVLYAVSLFIAGIIETIGVFVMLFAHSAISAVTPDVASHDRVSAELGLSLVGGDVRKAHTQPTPWLGNVVCRGGHRLCGCFILWSSLR